MQVTQPPLPIDPSDEETQATHTAAVAVVPTANVSTAVEATQNGSTHNNKSGKRPRTSDSGSRLGTAVATGDAAAATGGQARKQRRTDRRGLDKKGGKANALVNKWQHVAKELEEDSVRICSPCNAMLHYRRTSKYFSSWTLSSATYTCCGSMTDTTRAPQISGPTVATVGVADLEAPGK